MGARARLTVLAAAALVAMALPTAANHVQTESGRIIVFDHVTGNEWWVEVALSGQDAGSVASVEAMDTNGAWVTLAKKSWGPYAASFHIEPGHQVRFRANWAGGAQSVSCWFTHPAGAEQCSTSPPPPPPPGWTARTIGDGQSNPAGHDLAVGDVDRDGRPEIYMTNAQQLWQFSWTSTGWVRSQVASWHATEHVAVGDITGDGHAELFASGPSGWEDRDTVSQYQWDGQSWSSWGMFTTDAAGTQVNDLLVADLEADGRADLVFGTSLPRSLLMQIEYEDVGGYESYNTRFVVPFDTSVTALAVGDPNNVGVPDTVVGQQDGTLYRAELLESQGTISYVGDTGAHPVRAIAIGAPEGDGQNYLYAAHGGQLTRWKGQQAAFWEPTIVADGGVNWSPMDLAVGNADNVGFPELLATGNDGNLYRLVWVNGGWSTRVLAATEGRGTLGLLVGDGDGDGLREAYLAGPGVNAGTHNPLIQVMDHAVPARPPAPWHEMLVGSAGGRSGESDLAIGDGDRDGQREVYVAAREGLYQFQWTGAAWERIVLSGGDFQRVAVGDGDRDGRTDVYAAGRGLNGGYQVLRFVPDGTGSWTSSVVHASTLPVGTMTLGDVDDDGATELYIAMMPEYGGTTGSAPSYQLEFEGGGWQVRHIANLDGGARSSWIGDADRDGDRDWYLVGSQVHKLDVTPAGAGSSQLISSNAEGYWFNGIASVDNNRDGQQELFVGFSLSTETTYSVGVLRFAVRTGGWDQTTIHFPQQAGPRDLAFGDADGDGTSELYASAADGAVWQVRWTGSSWALRSMADIGSELGADLALGDADGDDKVEAYMTAFDTSRSPPHNVYRLGSVPPPVSFDASFGGVRGNEWWIQASTVDAAGGTLAKVDVRLNGGAWQPLTKHSWGGWAASYRAVQGTLVQLRATASDGATDLSSCYQWIPPSGADAAVVPCGSSPPSGFDASFSNVKGNDWWVEAKVTANQALAGVDARVNCAGTWKQLELKSWGSWAASFNVPAGSKVDFRARSTGGATDLSGGYVWPNATTTSAC